MLTQSCYDESGIVRILVCYVTVKITVHICVAIINFFSVMKFFRRSVLFFSFCLEKVKCVKCLYCILVFPYCDIVKFDGYISFSAALA